jgi:RNA polymerase sigma-B factor
MATTTYRPRPTSTSTAAAADATTAMLASLATMPSDHPGRAALRERVIAELLPLAHHLARRYRDRGEPLDDLVQVATVGLIKAVDRFDADRGVDVVGFAIPTIIGEIKRHFRDRTWSVRVPRRLQELRIAISDANTALNQTLGRSPTVAQVAEHLGVTEEDVLEGMEGARAYKATSLATPTGGDENAATLGDMLGTDDPGYDNVDARLTLRTVMATLPERERQILILRFHGNLTQQQIADRIGMSQMHVSRLITKTLARLRDQIGELH